MQSETSPFLLETGRGTLDLRPFPAAPTLVMGILNVTPDSFSDGGAFLDVEDAVNHALQMIRDGADIIDVGGESSRPKGSVYGAGASKLSEVDEIERILPVIRRLIELDNQIIISVDTYKPDVARRALEAGASLINDITALRFAPELAHVAAEFDAPLVLMHSVGSPGEMPHTFVYRDVVEDVVSSLEQAINKAQRAGVNKIILDPGFGFGKTSGDNLRLLNEMDRLLELNRPVLIGISRKSTIGKVLGGPSEAAPVHERLFGSLGATAVSVFRGASIVRTHDVKETREFLDLMFATAHPDFVSE